MLNRQTQMKINEFNKTYKEKGGMPQLNEFRSYALPLQIIAKHFTVSKERIRQWFELFYKEKYDPRPERRKKIVDSMIDFAKKNTEEDFREAFEKGNITYFALALAECYDKGIYVDDNQLKLNI